MSHVCVVPFRERVHWWLMTLWAPLGVLSSRCALKGGGALHRLDTICWLACDKRMDFFCTHTNTQTTLHTSYTSVALFTFFSTLFTPLFLPNVSHLRLCIFTFFAFLTLFLVLLFHLILFFFLPVGSVNFCHPSPVFPFCTFIFPPTFSLLHFILLPHFHMPSLSLCVLYPQLLLSFLLKYLPCSLPPVWWECLGVKDYH